MFILFGLIGLVIGAGIGGFWGAVLLGAGGVWLGIATKSKDPENPQSSALPEPGPVAPVSQEVETLQREILSLRRRVDRLERLERQRQTGQSPTGAPQAQQAVDDWADTQPPVEPTAVAVPVPQAASAQITPSKASLAVPAPGMIDLAPAADAATATQILHAALPPLPSPSPLGPEPLAQAAPAPAASGMPDWPDEAPVELQARAPKSFTAQAPQEPSFIARLFSGNIVAKVGVVVLFFGVGFLLKFAYDHGMLPPPLRLFAVAATSVVMFFVGQRLLESRRLYGLILQGGASGLAYLDVFFALKTYGFISPTLGFSLFALLGVATTFLAVRRDSRSLAVLGLGGAFLAPVLASTGGGSHVMLFSYYLLLNLFILGVSWFRAWRELNLTGWAFTFVIGLFWGNANYRPEFFASVEPFVLAFFAIYVVVPILFATRQPPLLKGVVDGTLVFGTPAVTAFMQAALVKDMPNGLAWSAAIASGLYALLAATTWRRENMRLLAETYAALAVGLGTLAVFFAFDAYPTFAFWSIEGAALLWVGLRQDRPLARAFAILVQLAGAGLFISQYGEATWAHPVFNDVVYGCLIITVASLISSRLLYRHSQVLREWESWFAPAMLLWGALWWSVGGLDAMHHGLDESAMPNAVALFFMATFVVAELAGRWMGWNPLRHLAAFHPLVLAAVLVAQFAMHQHPLGGLGAWVWPLGLASAFWVLRRQEIDGSAFVAKPRYLALWSVLALAATWEQIWLWQHEERLYGLLLALAGHGAAYLRFHWRERTVPTAPPASVAVLLWSMIFWFGHAHAWMFAHWSAPTLIAAMLGFTALSALLYETLGTLCTWRSLRLASSILWPAMAIALLTKATGTGHPLESFGWLAWPAAMVVAYTTLHRHERDKQGYISALWHALGLWVMVVLAGLELNWLVQELKMGTAWQTSVWGFCSAAALGGVVFWGNCGRWPVGPHLDLYRGLVLLPVGLFSLAWALFANFKAPGSMAPLPYLPLLNPVDAMVGASLGALWWWSRWFIEPDQESPGMLRKAAAALAFIWLNGIALRSIHFWADVPYEFAMLYKSVLAQATLSLLWAGAAMALMFLARQRLERSLWIAGASLLGLVVAKLFLVDLANSGTVERIVSFIGVGALLLGIGYLAPVPPGEEVDQTDKPT